MRYSVRGIEINSENAARSMMEAAGPLIEWLDNLQCVNKALDYGCGKLRYTRHVAKKCSVLGLADSRVQLDRNQRIDGIITSVRQYAKSKWPACRIYDLEAVWQGIPETYDFVLCSNVLSAIPCPKIRTKSIRAIHRALSQRGELLVVNQHTNSFFSKAKSGRNTFAHLDGWVAQSGSRGTFYGFLTKDSVVRLLSQRAFVVKDAWIAGQSNYVLAAKKS